MNDDERRGLILEWLDRQEPDTAACINSAAVALRRRLMDRAGRTIRLSHEGTLELLFAIGRYQHVLEAEQQAKLRRSNGARRKEGGYERAR